MAPTVRCRQPLRVAEAARRRRGRSRSGTVAVGLPWSVMTICSPAWPAAWLRVASGRPSRGTAVARVRRGPFDVARTGRRVGQPLAHGEGDRRRALGAPGEPQAARAQAPHRGAAAPASERATTRWAGSRCRWAVRVVGVRPRRRGWCVAHRRGTGGQLHRGRRMPAEHSGEGRLTLVASSVRRQMSRQLVEPSLAFLPVRASSARYVAAAGHRRTERIDGARPRERQGGGVRPVLDLPALPHELSRRRRYSAAAPRRTPPPSRTTTITLVAPRSRAARRAPGASAWHRMLPVRSGWGWGSSAEEDGTRRGRSTGTVRVTVTVAVAVVRRRRGTWCRLDVTASGVAAAVIRLWMSPGSGRGWWRGSRPTIRAPSRAALLT